MQQEAQAQAFIYQHSHAALATVEANGGPFCSAVNVVPDHEGRLLMLVSELAEHSLNLRHDARASLLWVEQRHSDWQAATRLTVSGQVMPVPPEQGGRYLQVFPQARDYLQLDFHFLALRPRTVRWIPGFARATWLDGDALAQPWGWDLAREQAMVGHMNDDHGDALDHYLTLLGSSGQGARMLAVDPWGAWLWHDRRLHRLPFPARAEDAGQVRETLVMLARTRPEDFFLARP
ncbi:pyridoxamine 5'-phosphate oxidase-like FMN-binding protein [Alcanivorax hongdengensis A-11-3]|uniref:Pyridoxamine 5'-phosphate oxidase-like FMN-binding protein n=1 Tax=Alcanivorax hongdengensis A-11-3 TaxID=1177179 RepID=L0WBS0_9GAMM|nr:DUF2470 domain-containing protein [Alcanivorax hongdengensis]EKF74228.1 pyridoxamine 5'-phosphate oxidase-like FMN-binding protein [Alcanivorax hongdengensis A-11-3]